MAVDLREAQYFRPDQDAEQDLEYHGGEDEPGVEPGQDRAGARRGEHEHEGGGVRRRLGATRMSASRCGGGVSPHPLVNDSPGSCRISASPVRNAFGGQVIGSTARRAGSTSGSGSPVKTIR